MRGMGLLLAASLAALSAAGCATTDQASDRTSLARNYGATGTSVDRLFRNDGVEATRERPTHAYDPEDGRLLAAYNGIEGARAAHLVYATPQAEQLDGACESSVRVASGETLYDIADLCDVSLVDLLEANPDVRNPRLVEAGHLVHVPGLPDPERQAIVVSYLSGAAPAHSLQAGLPAAVYVAQEGDSLEKISLIHRVSEARVATLNPDVKWDNLKPGQEIRLPAQGAALATPAKARSVAATSKKEKDPTPPVADSVARAVGAADTPDDIARVMPYRSKPERGALVGAGPDGNLLGVDRTFVAPGSEVELSADRLPPNARVTISRGANRGDLKEVTEARTGPDGRLKARVPVPVGADAGGVVFKATVDDNGATLYSERVGVETIKKD